MMAGKPKHQKMIEAIKTIAGYNGIPLPAGCPTFFSILIKILDKYNASPKPFAIDDRMVNIAILNEAMHTFSVMLNYFTKDDNRNLRFATDSLNIFAGTMKTSNPKRVTKRELSNYFLKHASLVPDLIPDMSPCDMVEIFYEIENIVVSRQAVSSNPIYNSLVYKGLDRSSTVKVSDYSKTHRFYKEEERKEPDETSEKINAK